MKSVLTPNYTETRRGFKYPKEGSSVSVRPVPKRRIYDSNCLATPVSSRFKSLWYGLVLSIPCFAEPLGDGC